MGERILCAVLKIYLDIFLKNMETGVIGEVS